MTLPPLHVTWLDGRCSAYGTALAYQPVVDVLKQLFCIDNNDGTVSTHVRNILTKIGCANRTEAAAYAVRHGLSEA